MSPEGGEGHRFAAGTPEVTEAARKGGLARAQKRRAIAAAIDLGLGDFAHAPEFLLYLTDAEKWRKQFVAQLARDSGGVLGAAAGSMAMTAAIQQAASRYQFVVAAREKDPIDQSKLFGRASALGNDSRQNMLSAMHIAHADFDAFLKRQRAKIAPALRGASDDEKLAEKKRREEAMIDAEGEEVAAE